MSFPEMALEHWGFLIATLAILEVALEQDFILVAQFVSVQIHLTGELLAAFTALFQAIWIATFFENAILFDVWADVDVTPVCTYVEVEVGAPDIDVIVCVVSGWAPLDALDLIEASGDFIDKFILWKVTMELHANSQAPWLLGGTAFSASR